MDLLFATNNRNKIIEIQNIIGHTYTILGLDDIGFSGDIPEEQDTLEGNASQKTNFIHKQFHINCFADDTGLEVIALNNLPGVYSARYAGPQKNPDDNIDKLLARLNNKTDRRAQFRTIISLILNNKEYLFEGIVRGNIIKKRKGSSGFGYDPVFQPDGFIKTFAEMSLEEKNLISHRALATNKLIDFLKHAKY